MSLKRKGWCKLGIDHQHARWREVESGAIRALLKASEGVRFAGHGRAEVYAWIGKTLREQDYGLGQKILGQIAIRPV